jgi:hypothetical protein
MLRGLPGVAGGDGRQCGTLSGGGSSTSLYTEPNEKGRAATSTTSRSTSRASRRSAHELVEGRDLDARW